MKSMISLLLLLFAVCSTVGAQKSDPNDRRLKVYKPSDTCRTAIIVCPGGSYCWLSKKYEGSEVARWLNSEGIAAYVLHYPTAGWAGFALRSRLYFPGRQYPDQLRAIERAMRLVRAEGYRHVGIMGFSAGGHLSLMAAENLTGPLRPDFIAPIYPVVSLSHAVTHKRSRRGLLGEWRRRSHVMRDSLSMERHADRIQCPVFLMNCKDDPIVDYRNAMLMDSAMTAHNVPHVYIQYQTGGHGFGATARKTSPEAIGWKQRFIEWLRRWVESRP